MSNRIEFSPEIVRLAQTRVKETGSSLADELARLAVEEVIMNADPELDLVLDTQDALSSIDSVVAAVGANDVMVNGRRIDVRAVDEEGFVSLHKALVGTPALSSGTLVVHLEGTSHAAVVAHVKSGSWLNAEEKAHNTEPVKVEVELDSEFDAVEAISGITQRVQINLDKAVSRVPENSEIEQFLNAPDKMIVARQKQIVTALCSRAELRDAATQVKVDVSKGELDRMLRAGSTWNRRTEELVDKLSPRFQRITRDELKKHVTLVGEELGGQPEAPAFRKALIKKLTNDQLSRQFGGAAMAKVKNIYDQVMQGKSSSDAVKQIVKNHVAVDIALAIKNQRNKVEGFMSATAEEIGMAFQQLAIQPAYATHSTGDAGVDSINEALQLLEAAELAETMREIEEEMVQS